MEQRTEQNLSPYRTYSRAEWARLRADAPMTLTSDEVMRLHSLHDRLDIKEVEEIYLPLSRLLSMYVDATQRLFVAQQRFLGTEDTKMPFVIGVAGSVAVGKSTMLGASASAQGIAAFCIALLIGFEASTIRRWTLTRRGWATLGFVVGEDQDVAERRFFTQWAAGGSKLPEPPVPATPAPVRRGPPTGRDVIGLFPEPGQNR